MMHFPVLPGKRAGGMGQRPLARLRRALLAGAACCLMMAAGASYAYLQTMTLPVQNTIQLGDVHGCVTEEITGGVKKNVAIKNTGSLAAYIRVKTLASFRSGDTVLAAIPVAGTDYTVTFTADANWVQGADSYWYYRKPVAPGASTPVLITKCEAKPLGPGKTFQYDILASLIQAGNPQAVESWSNSTTTVSVGADGLLIVSPAAQEGGGV